MRPQQQARMAPVFPAVESPKFSLALPGEPTISTVSSHVEPQFSMEDERLETEKSYYPGETDPHHWRDAVTILPMEAFEPDLEKLLRKRVLKSLINCPDYDRVKLKVTSFYVALDERERARTELIGDFEKWDTAQAELQEEKKERRVRDSEDDGFGDRVAKGLLTATIVTPAERRKYNDARAEQLLEYPQTLPHNLTEKLETGWNCNIEAQLILTSTDQPAQVITLTVLSQSIENDSKTVPEQIQNVVNAAVSDLQQQIRSADAENSGQ